MENSRLLLHCGAGNVDRSDLGDVELPVETRSYCPVPHDALVNEVTEAMEFHKYDIQRESHALSHSGQRYFGLLELHSDNLVHDNAYNVSIGVRNSHDKKFPAGIVVGARVFVCDNLSFSGEIQLSRRHTRHIIRDLPNLVGRTIMKIGGHLQNQQRQFSDYQARDLTDDRARSLIVECVKRGAIGCTHLPRVLEQWEKPNNNAFEEKNVWRLFNAVTEVAKSWTGENVVRRTQLLHGICDAEVGFATAS